METETLIQLDKFVCPLGKQEIQLQQVDYATGGMSLLRVRIREKSRFTVFEIDPESAARWGQAMLDWAKGQPRA